MAWTRQQTAVYTQAPGSGATSVTATITSTTANNLLVIGFSGINTPTFSFTGGSPTISSATTITTPVNAGIWFVPRCPAGITAVTATMTFGDAAIVVGEYNDGNGGLSSPLDVVSTNDNGFGSANPWTSGTTSTLAGINDLAIGLGVQWRGVVGSLTATGSWTANGTPLASTSGGEPALILQDILGTGSTTGVAATGNFSAVGSQQVEAFVATFQPAIAATSGSVLPMFIQTNDIFWKAI